MVVVAVICSLTLFVYKTRLVFNLDSRHCLGHVHFSRQEGGDLCGKGTELNPAVVA